VSSVYAQQKKIDLPPLAPAFNVSSIDGKIFDSEKLKGKIVIRKSGIKGVDAVKAELKRQFEPAPTKTE